MPGPDERVEGDVVDVPVRADRRAQTLDGLGPGLLAAGLAIGGSMPVHLVVGSVRESDLLAAVTGGVALVMLLAWAALRLPAVRATADRRPHEAALSVAVVAAVVPAAEMVVFPTPVSVGGLLVVLLAGGALIHHRPYAIGLTAACVAATGVVAAGQDLRDGWGPVTAIVVTAAVLAHVLRGMRTRAADELARAEVAVLEAAVTDELTGLSNRRGLLEAGERASADGASGAVSVLYLDVDGLKTVNDRFGHAAGDRLVRAAATALLRTARPGDVVARLGGDEFAVLLPGTDADAALEVRDRLQQVLVEAGVSASVGTASSATATAMDRLLDEADAAMYAVKQLRRGTAPLGAGTTLGSATPGSTTLTGTTLGRNTLGGTTPGSTTLGGTTAPAPRDDRDARRTADRAATDRLLGGPGGAGTTALDLVDLARAGVWLHLVVAPAHLLLLPTGPDRVMAVASVVLAGLFGLFLLPPLRPLVPRHADAMMCAALVLLCAETVGYAALTTEPWALLATVLAVVGVGGALVRTRQVVVVCTLTTAAWAAVALRHGPGSDGAWYVVSIGCALAVAALLHVSHRSTLTRLKAAEARVRAVALTDELTGLPNRRAFLQAGRPVVELSLRRGEQASVLFLDLDGLKQVNDAQGHAAGDRLLATAAEVLRRSLGPHDLVARLGGDEFTVLVHGDPPSRVPTRIAWLEAAFAEHGVSASIGAAHLPEDGRTLDGLVDRADEDMLRVKDRRRRVSLRAGQPGVG